jgi:hypothetical protein
MAFINKYIKKELARNIGLGLLSIVLIGCGRDREIQETRLSAISPNSGIRGQSVLVTLTGTNFVAGASIGLSSTAIVVSNTTVVSANQITATFTIAGNAATGSQNVTVMNAGGVSSGTRAFTINPAPPTVGSITPSSGIQGQSVPVTLTGTNLVAGATIGLSGTGISVSNTTVVSATQMTATLTVASNAATGPYQVMVTTSGGTSSAKPFTVSPSLPPTLTSISAASAVQGQSVPVTLTGICFIAGATIGLSGTGIVVSNTAVVSGTQITATFTIAGNATAGVRNVTVTTSAGISGAQTFTVSAASPTFTAISPNSGVHGLNVPVTLTGANFITGATIGLSGTGVAVSNTVVINATQISALFAIAGNATVGVQNVSITTAGGTSGVQAFTVNQSPPTISAISPNTGVQGQSMPVTLTGTNFIAGATIGLNGSGITVSGTTVVSATQITATITILGTATVGVQNVSVTTAGGTSGVQTFRVNQSPPTLSAISPNSGIQGQSAPVTLTGTNFVAGATIGLGGTGVTVSGTTVMSATQIIATFTILGTATTGAYNVSVTNGGGTSGVQTFTVNQSPPSLSAISPNTGVQGQSVPVTLTGTDFLAGATIGLSSTGITVSGTTVVSATQITATFTILGSATVGVQNVTVTTTAGTSGVQTFTVNLLLPPTLISISSNSGAQGQSVPVTLTGSNFVTGATIGLSGTSITITDVVVRSLTQIEATFIIAGDGVATAQNITVTTMAGTSGAQVFTVNQAPPTLNLISPNGGIEGQSVSVTLTGTNFIAGATIGLSGGGITVSNTTVASATQITATFTIAGDAAVGANEVTVTTSGGASGNQMFTVDLLAPTLSYTSPINGAADVPINRKITATFGKTMTALTTATFTVSGGGSSVVGEVNYDATNNTAIFRPTSALAASTSYTATIDAAATDSAGNPLSSSAAAPNPWTFTTGTTADTTSPTVNSVYPIAHSLTVPINQKITVTFSEAMNSSTLTTSTFVVQQGMAAVVGSGTYAGTTATFTPASPLTANTDYEASVTAGAKDLAGNGLTGGGLASNSWTFRTSSSADNSPTTVRSTSPGDGASAVPIDATVNAVFSQGLDPATVTSGTFTVSGPGTTPVNGAVTYDATSNVATFTPESNLAPNVFYTAAITTGAHDLRGNPLAAGGLAVNPWTFTIGTTTESPAPVNLGSAASYAILAGATVTNVGASFINGDLGLSPGTAVTGFGPGIQNGAKRISPDAGVALAKTDLTAAFNDATGRTTNQVIQPTGELGGLTLTPGLYTAPAPGSFTITSMDLTLDAQGNSSAVWIFQMPASTLTVESGRQVVLINGAKSSNIFWQVGSSSTLGTLTLFRGNILASQSVTLQTGAIVDGRVLTQAAAITLDTNTVTKPAQ